MKLNTQRLDIDANDIEVDGKSLSIAMGEIANYITDAIGEMSIYKQRYLLSCCSRDEENIIENIDDCLYKSINLIEKIK